MRPLVLAILVTACSTPGTAIDASRDASAVRTITLTNDVFNDPGPGARLSDGATLGAAEGDLWLAQRSTVSIFMAAPLGICGVGTFGSLDAVPTDPSACRESAPAESVILGGNANGTNQWAGQAWLIFPSTSASTPSYRARAASDSDVNPAITLTIEYEPLP